MKAALTSYARGISLLSRRKVGASCAVAMLAVSLACRAPNTTDDKGPGSTGPTGDVYVALSGGGWRTHTAHAGWTIGLLDNQAMGPQQTLDQIFTNVLAVSSNSGGSWFNMMLAFSDDFRKQIESKNAASTYLMDSSGYFLSEKMTIQSFPETDECDLWSSWPQIFFLCVVGEGIGAPLDWDALIRNVVFEPFSMSSRLTGTTLGGGPHQAWANGKALLVAATMLTNEVVLTGSNLGDKYYYSAPNLGVLNVVPATFSNLTPPAGPNFLPSAPAPFDLTYSNTVWLGHPPRATAKGNHGNLDSSTIDVITAAAASSAAAGFVASRGINENNGSFLKDVPLSDWEIAFEADELALFFNLPDPTDPKARLTRSSTAPQSNDQTNASQRFVQIADGGPLDNSGVAQIVSFHQKKNGAPTPFTIVTFDNVQEIYTPNRSGRSFSPVGIDIAALFGAGFTDLGDKKEGFCTAASKPSKGFCITVVDRSATPLVSPQVFDTAGIGVDATWTYTIDAQHQLIYTRYSVTTVDSPLMGVRSGWTGTMHAFTCQWADAGTTPWTTSKNGKLGDEDWKAYAAMFEAIQTGLKTKGGLKHLRAALGLP